MSRNDLAQGKLRSCGGGPASTAALLGGGGSRRAAFARSWPEKNNDAVTCARVVIRKMARLAIDWLRTLVPCPSLQRPQAVMVATSKTRLPKETCSTGTLPHSAHARGGCGCGGCDDWCAGARGGRGRWPVPHCSCGLRRGLARPQRTRTHMPALSPRAHVACDSGVERCCGCGRWRHVCGPVSCRGLRATAA